MGLKYKDSLAVVIPMHNEAKGASRCVRRVMEILPTLTVRSKLIVVNDGSTDKTLEILSKLRNQFPKRLVVTSHPVNRGYGAGLATGVKKAYEKGFSHVVFMDSDLTNDPKDLNKFSLKMHYDLVKASRYIQGGGMVGVPRKRRAFSQVGNLLCRLSFRMGLQDYTNGFRMVRTKLLAHYRYQEKGFAIILEEMYLLKIKRAKCSEIPVTLTARTNTTSHFHYTAPLIWAYLKYALKASVV